MKNNFFSKIFWIFILFALLPFKSNAEQFNFKVSEIEILNNGNLFKGLNRGIIETDNGLIIEANKFVYDKLQNILNASGEVKVNDTINKYNIFSDKITYKKNEEVIFSTGNSKAIDNNQKIIKADNFTYDKKLDILNAKKNVFVQDGINNYELTSEEITYNKKKEELFSTGKTEAIIESKYNFEGENILFLLKSKQLSSESKIKIKVSNSQIYLLDEFLYLIDEEILKGKNILTISNYGLPKSDKAFFSEGIINLKKNSFAAKNPKIEIHNGVFGNEENNPRIYGVSSTGNNNKTTINKAIFTSCKKDDGCPPWSIKADQIEHDKNKRQINYKNAFLNVYDIPILYFPKFFHPDPSVERQSGLLKPALNNSNLLGSSLTIPYFKVISKNKDFTFAPTWFDNKILMAQNEYRQTNEKSKFIADFGFVNGYKSSLSKKKNNLSHLFANFDLNLDLKEFDSSKLTMSIEQVSNDTYLKIFDAHITKSILRPDNFDILNNKLKLSLDHERYNFEAGIESYEDLQLENNDRYQYVLPYYNYSTILDNQFFNSTIGFKSSGSNNLNNTNDLKTNIINDISLNWQSYISNLGFLNSYSVDVKNLNSLGKKNSEYKSSPQIEFVSIFTANTSIPLIKEEKNYTNFLIPKASLKINPSDMKNYSTSEKKINVGNIFSNNRLGFEDTLESGKSLTLGVDYKRENNDLDKINNYFEVKLATVLRDKIEQHIPTTSTLNKKNSNLFGSISNNFSDQFKLNYNFAIDNDLNKFEYNDFNATLSINNLVTTFNFIEENGVMGNTNAFENSISYTFDENNYLSFKTRRNRKLNLTEYYDLVYEYKNDCLTAGIKYKKSYYQDRDLKPTENLLFTLTLFPLTTYEYVADELLEN